MMTRLGTTLKHLRIASHIKQKAMAERLGISPAYLSMIENDQREPSIEIIEKYAEILDVPVTLLTLHAENHFQDLNREQLKLFEQIRQLLFQFQKLKLRSAIEKHNEK